MSSTPTLRPQGTPIGTRVVIPRGAGFAPLRHTLSVIDRLHGDGQLPRLLVQLRDVRTSHGGYEWRRRTGEPIALYLSVHAAQPHLVVAHEIAHFLDQQVLGRGGALGSESGELDEVLSAIRATETYRALQTLRGRKQVRIRLARRRPEIFRLTAATIEELLEPKELFARAYAQFVTLVSQDPILLAELASRVGDPIVGRVYHAQWASDDFAPIATAIEGLVRRQRWVE